MKTAIAIAASSITIAQYNPYTSFRKMGILIKLKIERNRTMKSINLSLLLAMFMLFIACCLSEAGLKAQETLIVANILAAQTVEAPITTPTPNPGGIVSGRVYLMDRDKPVRTTVTLALREGFESVAVVETDEKGHYSFLVKEPNIYVIQISVMDLLDICDKLRTETGVWMVVRTYDESGVTDIKASSYPIEVAIGDEITYDCELYCD